MTTDDPGSDEPVTDEPVTDERHPVASEQDDLVRALVGTAPPPPRFGPAPAGTGGAPDGSLRESPRDQRTREAADAWPQLARCLGPVFAEQFEIWAEEHPVPTGIANPWADGLAFALERVPTSQLDTDALVERQRGRALAVIRRPRAVGAPAKVRRRRGPLLLVKRSSGRRGSRKRFAVTLTITPDHVRTWIIPRR